MSSYLSNPYEIQQPTALGDIALTRDVLKSLQGKYDSAKAEIDSTLALYSTQLKGLRDVDNQYISAKLKEVTNAIDQYSIKNGNLAYSYNKDAIVKAITSVSNDPIVQNAIVSRKNKENYDKQYQEILKKNPNLANDANYAYGQYTGGYYDYMQGKSKALGQMQYTPYTDLTEENLKKLKLIKDVSGKRFIETPDPDNPGRIIRKEIDGLEDWQINQYLGSTMTSQELNQMRINSWAKFGSVNIENNKANIQRQFDEYNNQKINAYTDKKTAYLAIADNTSYSDTAREEARRKANEMTESINDLKLVDSTKLDATSMAFGLERASYLNGISQLAKSEWSTEYKKDDAYFANQNLDIAKQNLEIAKERLGLAKFQAYQKSGVDSNGNPVQIPNAISQTPFTSELADTLSKEQAGQGTLITEHNQAYNAVIGEASNFMNTANDEDVRTVKADLNARGVEVIGNQIRFKNPEQHRNESLANTIFESFKSTNKLTYEMYKSNEIKQQKAKDLITVRKEAYSKVFNQNADDYINNLKSQIRTAEIDGQSDLFENSAEEAIQKAQAAKNFVNANGGWANLKSNLQRNPEKLSQFADVLGDLTDRFNKTKLYKDAVGLVVSPVSTYLNSNLDLRKNASADIEQTIQNKTKSGVMFSAYNQFNITNNKLRESVVSKIVDSEIQNGDEAFDPKKNITIRKQGDQLYLTQRVETKGKIIAHDIKYVINPQSTLYNELSGYIETNVQTADNYIKADKDTQIAPMKVSIPSYSTSKTGQQTMMYKVENNVPVEAKKAFGIVGGQPGRLATTELASETIKTVLTGAGIPNDKAELYKNTVLANLPAYSIKTVVKQNPAANFRNEFAIEVVDNKGKRITDGFLGTDKLSYDMKYSMEMYPQVYVLNQLLYSAYINRNNIDQEINKL